MPRLRDFGYTFSEGRLARWMTLLVADRINVIEDLVIDLAHGHVPNILKEMGAKSELKYNPVGLARKIAIVGLCGAALMAYSRRRTMMQWNQR